MSEHRAPDRRPQPRRYATDNADELLDMILFEARARKQLRALARQYHDGLGVLELNDLVCQTFDSFWALYVGLKEPQWLIEKLAPMWAKFKPLAKRNYEAARAQAEAQIEICFES